MATYAAIAAACEAIIGLLRRARPKEEEFAKAGFEVYVGENFETPLFEEGISLYLYRVTISGARRNLPPTITPDGRRFRPPLPLDLHLLLSAWGKASVQHRLLAWAMRELENTPILPAGLLNSTGPEEVVFRPEETVELVCEPLPLADMINLWEALKPKSNRPLSVNYVARMICIESQIEMHEYAPVQARQFDYGKGPKT